MQKTKHTDKRGRRSQNRPDLYLKGVAVQVGITSGYLSRLISGKRKPSLTVARNLARVLGVSLDELDGTLQAARANQQ